MHYLEPSYLIRYIKLGSVKLAPLKTVPNDKYIALTMDDIDFINTFTPEGYLLPCIGNYHLFAYNNTSTIINILKDSNDIHYACIDGNNPMDISDLSYCQEDIDNYYRTYDLGKLAELYKNKEMYFVKPIYEKLELSLTCDVSQENKVISFIVDNLQEENSNTEHNTENLNHLSIIGALLALLKEKNKNMTQTKIILELEDKYKNLSSGFSQSNLEKEFAKCNKSFKKLVYKT